MIFLWFFPKLSLSVFFLILSWLRIIITIKLNHMGKTLQFFSQNIVTCYSISLNSFCRTRHSGGPKKFIDCGKRTDFWHLVLWWGKVLFKESPPSIMVTRNPNWSTEILWYRTGYVKGKILSPLKRSAWGRLHCWFCLKLLNIYSLMLWWFVYNIPDSGASEYSSSNNSNSGVGKNS
jgi:hypothetical protein